MQCTKSTQYALENENEKDKINNKNSRRTYAISSCVIIYPYILYRLQHVRFPIIGFFCGTDDITQSSIILFFTIKGVTSCRSMYIISRNSSRALVVACLYNYCRSQSLFIPDCDVIV